MSAGKNSDTQGSGLVRTSAGKRAPEREALRTTGPESVSGKPSRLSPAQVAGAGLRQIAELTGREVVGVTSIKALEDGWLVEVEAVEDRRIPSSGDLLALYEAQLGADGELLGYRRRKRYTRGWGDKGEQP